MNIKKRSRKILASCMLGDPSLLNVNDVNRVLDYQFKQLYTRDTLIYNRIRPSIFSSKFTSFIGSVEIHINKSRFNLNAISLHTISQNFRSTQLSKVLNRMV